MMFLYIDHPSGDSIRVWNRTHRDKSWLLDMLRRHDKEGSTLQLVDITEGKVINNQEVYDYLKED